MGAATIGKRRSTPSASWGSWALLKHFEVLLLLCTQWHQSDWYETNRADRKPKQKTDRPWHLHAKWTSVSFTCLTPSIPLTTPPSVVALQVAMWLTHTAIIVPSSPTHSPNSSQQPAAGAGSATCSVSNTYAQEILLTSFADSVLAWKKPNWIDFTQLSQQGRQLYMPSMGNRLRIWSANSFAVLNSFPKLKIIYYFCGLTYF